MTTTNLPELVTTTETTSSPSSTSTLTTHTTSSTSSLTTSSNVDTTLSTSYTSLTSSRTSETSTSSSSITYQATVPTATVKNPYLLRETYHQGTFYVIFLPIIAALLLIYFFGILWLRIKASRLTKSLNSKSNTQKLPLTRRKNNSNEDIEKENYFDTYSIPEEENGFFTLQKDINMINNTTNGVDMSMVKSASMNSGFGISVYDLGNNRNDSDKFSLYKSPSRTSLDLLNTYTTNSIALPKPHDATKQYDYNLSNGNNKSTSYSHRPTRSVLELDKDLILKPGAQGSTSHYKNSELTHDLLEPQKTAKSNNALNSLTGASGIVLTRSNTMKKGHRKTRSGLVLDEFISTGTLPQFDEIQGTSNSMYQDDVDTYRVTRSNSPSRPISPNRSRFPSPERK